MSDLEDFAAHARQMAAMTEPKMGRQQCRDKACDGWAWHTHAVVVTPLPTDAERALWRQLASEIDAYLSTEGDDMLPMEDA